LLLRSAFLPLAAALGGAAPPPAADEPNPFDGATVRNLARDLAQAAYKAPDASLPDTLNNLDYQAYRSIRFDPGHALWRGQGVKFTEEFFHRGFLYKQRDIFEATNGRAVPIRHSGPFTFDKVKPPRRHGFAGFRIHFPINAPTIDEFPASRREPPCGKRTRLRQSARGLAIKTADPPARNFPFRSFWLERPAYERHDRRALLDSPSAAAALRYHPAWRADCVRHRDGAVSRSDLATIGMAADLDVPVRRQRPTRVDDYRSAVHDSTGLLIWNGKGEQIWRPLANPRERDQRLLDSGPPVSA
jgi:glucans biosynthesis protein